MTPEELEEIRQLGQPVFNSVSWGRLARAVPKLVAEIDRLEAKLRMAMDISPEGRP